jgi:hypothetical protein
MSKDANSKSYIELSEKTNESINNVLKFINLIFQV